MKSGFLANFGYRCRILEVKKRKIIRISLGIHFWGLENATVRGSHGLSARRARRTKSRRPEGPKGGPKGHRLEVGARRAPKLLVYNKVAALLVDAPKAWLGTSAKYTKMAKICNVCNRVLWSIRILRETAMRSARQILHRGTFSDALACLKPVLFTDWLND